MIRVYSLFLGTSKLRGFMELMEHHLDEMQAMTKENVGRKI